MNETLAGLRPAQRDALRIAGAAAFAAGALALFIRKAETGGWAAFPKLLVLGIPCALLYGLGVGAIRLGRDDETVPAAGERRAAAWRAAAVVLGLVLMPLALAQLVDMLGGSPEKSGHTAWIALAVACAGFYAAFGRGVRWGALFGGLALIVSWMAFWDAITDPSSTAVRWLFVLVAAALAAAAFALRSEPEGPELATAAGLAGLFAGITGLLNVPSNLTDVLGGDVGLGASGAQQHQEWDVFLLLVALVLIWYGARAPWRGPAYVGGLTLFAFIISVGVEFSALYSGEGPSGDLVGWPLLLLVAGGGALLAGLYGGDGERSPPPPPSEHQRS